MTSRACRVVLLLLAACSPVGETHVTPVQARRDGDFIDVVVPAANGNIGSRLGTVVVHCDDDFLAAGIDGLVWADRNINPLGTLAPQADVLSCTGPAPHLVIAGGTAGLWRYTPGVDWELISDAGVKLFVRHPDEQTMLVSASTSRVQHLMTSQPLGAGSNGASWSAVGTEFALVAPQQVRLFTWVNSSATQFATVTARPGTAFTSAVVVGELNPASGLEVAVGVVDAGIEVFNESGLSLQRYDFGSSLAIERQYAGLVDGLLIGDPSADRVVLMVGDAGVREWRYPDAGEFGYAIASAESFNARDLAVGSPGYSSGAGAVFLYRSFRLDPSGTALFCDTTVPCSTPSQAPGFCTSGTCIGGVVCIDEVAGCPPGWDCLSDRCTPPDAGAVDAGVIDAGLFDAGVADAGDADAGDVDAGDGDAGSPADAGNVDAGLLDGGPPTTSDFLAVACTTVDGGQLTALVLFLVVARRRRGRSLS